MKPIDAKTEEQNLEFRGCENRGLSETGLLKAEELRQKHLRGACEALRDFMVSPRKQTTPRWLQIVRRRKH